MKNYSDPSTFGDPALRRQFLLATAGVAAGVGAPMAALRGNERELGQKSVSGSPTGSRTAIEHMLEFSARGIIGKTP
jgi:D-arabinose 1-dehydrogenase-like Zn-dependent alcohol dehydrogenase